MRHWKGILIFFFSFLAIHVFSQEYNFRNFTTDDGLSQSFIYSILQDENGYLWIGTGNGLSRYNGFIFENFTTSDSLADNFINCAIGDGEYQWFGHSNGWLTYYDGKKLHAFELQQSDLSPVTHFAKVPDGQIWVSTYFGDIFLLGKGPSVIKHYLFKDQMDIISFEFLNDNELLAGTNTGLLFCKLKESGEIEIIRTVTEIPESKIMNIQKMRNGSGFYIVTENDGIFQLVYTGNQLNVSKIITDPDFDFAGIQDIYEDSQSNLWLSSFGNGLIKINYSASGKFNEITILNTSTGFTGDNIKTVFEDREGIIWSGNYGKGLTQIMPRTFSIYEFDKNLYGNDIFSVCFNQHYRWIGTEKGLVKMDQSTLKILKFYSQGSGLPKDTVTTIYSANEKELWIGTGKNGVFRMNTENEKIFKYPVGQGALENSITIINGRGDQVWIGTKKGLFNVNSATGEKKLYSISQGGLPHNVIKDIYIDRTNIVWITTYSSILTHIMDGEVYNIAVRSTRGLLTLGPVTEDLNSIIWVGSVGSGIYRIEVDSVFNFTTKEGLLSDYCYSLVCDNNNNLWIGHKGGLSRLRTTDFSIKPIHQIADYPDSYQFNPNAIAKDQQGIIWFGSNNGLVSYDQSMETQQKRPPALGITSIRINDEERDYAERIVLPPGNYKIRIDYLGISLKDPALVNYRYQLKGYDQSPEITKNTFINYPHLTEGDYTFVLEAVSGDGAQSVNPLTFNLIIKEPVWKKTWFYLINLFLLVILTFTYFKRREHKLLIEKNILEEKVRERTYEIECQKNEIELQRDMINAVNNNITSSIRYASNIQNAIMPSLDLVNKLLPDNFILFRPKDIVSGDFYWITEKDNKIIFTVADCTGHGVPGAFMSILGITLLNEIVNIKGITRSDVILTNLREGVIQSLKQKHIDSYTKDGMDIALCVLDPCEKKIQYTGGMNDLIFIRNKKLYQFKADKLSVCFGYNIADSFTMSEIDYLKGDVFYLFSDGYQDQLGGDYDKKFLRKYLYTFLLEISELPMSTQKKVLSDNLNRWVKENTQTDDITIMGIRL